MGQEDVSGFSPRQKMAAGLASIPEDRIHEGLLMDFSIAENMILGRQWDSPFRLWTFPVQFGHAKIRPTIHQGI